MKPSITTLKVIIFGTLTISIKALSVMTLDMMTRNIVAQNMMSLYTMTINIMSYSIGQLMIMLSLTNKPIGLSVIMSRVMALYYSSG